MGIAMPNSILNGSFAVSLDEKEGGFQHRFLYGVLGFLGKLCFKKTQGFATGSNE
jgi:hypothetical protein